MSNVHSVDPGRVREIVEVFSAVTWPVEKERAASLGAECGWTLQRDRDRGGDFITGYAVDSPRAAASYAEGHIGQVSVDVTDRIRNADAAQAKALLAIARALRDDLVGYLGEPVGERGGTGARYTWNLGNGGRVAIAKLERVVQLIVLQKRYADIERGEERNRISDDRLAAADVV